jgi:SAM-dependent methyltransferase
MNEDLTTITACRACGSSALAEVVSLGRTPLANSLLPRERTSSSEDDLYPLNVVRCTGCSLVQLREIVSPAKLFSEYAYFSSVSDAIVSHARELAELLIARERLGQSSLVMEIASNDGYLLKAFKARGVPVLGIEPAANIARVAEEAGIPTLNAFFGLECAQDLRAEGRAADAIIGNNVLAHVPELRAFVQGVATVVKPTGVAVFEFPYVKDMLDKVEFDTIYHEHQCYYSLTALDKLFRSQGLDIHDVERIGIHGGSLRIFASPAGQRPIGQAVTGLLREESAWGVLDEAPYAAFRDAIGGLKRSLVELLDGLRRDGKRVTAYGAAAKGVTLTSYCGIGARQLEYVVDRSPYKQQLRFPVDALPIYPAERLAEDRPDYTLLLTWNFAAEIMAQQSAYTAAGGRFIVPVPTPRIV